MDIEKYIALTDRQLVRMSMDGDSFAFEHLFNRYRNSILQHYLQRRSGDSAEDLLQETFLKVYLNLERYNPDYTFGQWVFTIARNTFIDFMRRKQDDPTVETETAHPVISSPSLLPTPEESIINSQQRTQFEMYLGRMTPIYRKLIELRFLKDYSYEEIAKELGTPIGTVKTRIHRARTQLCRLITENPDALP